MIKPLAEQIKHLTPIDELSFEIIERLSVENDFFIHPYKTGEKPTYDVAGCFVRTTLDELKDKFEAYDQCIEENQGNNLEYFDMQPRDIDEMYNKCCDQMVAMLKLHQPHMYLHFDGAEDTYDVYVVSKQ